jgi:hypothetical protein
MEEADAQAGERFLSRAEGRPVTTLELASRADGPDDLDSDELRRRVIGNVVSLVKVDIGSLLNGLNPPQDPEDSIMLRVLADPKLRSDLKLLIERKEVEERTAGSQRLLAPEPKGGDRGR